MPISFLQFHVLLVCYQCLVFDCVDTWQCCSSVAEMQASCVEVQDCWPVSAYFLHDTLLFLHYCFSYDLEQLMEWSKVGHVRQNRDTVPLFAQRCPGFLEPVPLYFNWVCQLIC